MKSSGFNIEETHITDLKKLQKIFAITALALMVCVIAGIIKNSSVPIKIKNHGRKWYSLFTYGFDWLKEYFLDKKNWQLRQWFEILESLVIQALKPPLKQ